MDAAQLVSIIIPVYNAGDYLRLALESVQSQTLRDIECIVVDDGSTDNSIEIISEFMAADARIKLISQKNSGVAVARNTGIDNAHGKYIAFLDQDDALPANALQILFDAAESTGADLAQGNVRWVDNDFDAKNQPVENCKGFKLLQNSEKDFPDQIFKTKGAAWKFIWNKLFRREKLSNLRFTAGLQPCEDSDFVLRFAPTCDTIVNADAVVVFYRQSKKSFMHNGGKKTLKTLHAAVLALESLNNAIAQNPSWSEKYIRTATNYQESMIIKRIILAWRDMPELRGEIQKFILPKLQNYKFRAAGFKKKLSWKLFRGGLHSIAARVVKF